MAVGGATARGRAACARHGGSRGARRVHGGREVHRGADRRPGPGLGFRGPRRRDRTPRGTPARRDHPRTGHRPLPPTGVAGRAGHPAPQTAGRCGGGRVGRRAGPPGLARSRTAFRCGLRVTPETSLARIEGSATSRPLLEGPDPRGAAEALLGSRIACYRQSDITIETEGRSPEEVARAILEHPLLAHVNREECE